MDIDSEPTANNMNEIASQMKTTEVVEDQQEADGTEGSRIEETSNTSEFESKS